MTALYRHFDASGKLLYVGISMNPFVRTMAHSHGSAWMKQVARVEFEHFESREKALIAERDAIGREAPAHNKNLRRAQTYVLTQEEAPKPVYTKDLITAAGGIRPLAIKIGVTTQAIYAWGETVPKLRAYQLKDEHPDLFEKRAK